MLLAFKERILYSEVNMFNEERLMDFGAIIIGAGQGTRMKSSMAKVMHPVASLPMINHVLHAVLPLAPKLACAVAGPHNIEEISATVLPFETVLQQKANGTADAVKVTKLFFKDYKKGTIVVLFGDNPLITTETIAQLILNREKTNAGVSLLTFVSEDPTGYGRIMVGEDNLVEAIIEEKDASDEQKEVHLCNAGAMAIDASLVWKLINKIDNKNANGEFYLTSIVALSRASGRDVVYSVADEQELMGCDSKIDLATAEGIWQYRRRIQALHDGVLMPAPETVYFSWDTTIGKDVTIEPNVVFGEGVEIGDNVSIRAFSHLEECSVGNGANVGPYARIRPGAVLEENTKIGNFVEIKNARIGAGAKVNHLSYVGDSEVGQNTNIGAGTITCNYDGFKKSATLIGDNVNIGSNCSLIAPVEIHNGSIIGAGSVITQNVPSDALALGRANQENIEGAAEIFRAKREQKDK